MNKSHALSIALIAAASFSGRSVAGDIFDSPGPGYRQQIEQFSPPAARTRFFQIRFEPGWLSGPLSPISERYAPQLIFRVESPGPLGRLLPSSVPEFSQPIRLFISPQQVCTGLSLDTPFPATPKQFK
jgi:hypothetical protein